LASFDDLGKKWRRVLNDRLLPDPAQRRIVWAVIFFILLTVIIAGHARPEKVSLQVGQPAPRDIDAPRAIVNRPETDKQRQQKADTVPDVYELNPAVAAAAKNDVVRLFARIGELRADTALTAQQRLDKLRAEINANVDDATLSQAL
jgi:hypothetical protein